MTTEVSLSRSSERQFPSPRTRRRRNDPPRLLNRLSLERLLRYRGSLKRRLRLRGNLERRLRLWYRGNLERRLRLRCRGSLERRFPYRAGRVLSVRSDPARIASKFRSSIMTGTAGRTPRQQGTLRTNNQWMTGLMTPRCHLLVRAWFCLCWQAFVSLVGFRVHHEESAYNEGQAAEGQQAAH